jgi:membrane protein
VKKFVGLWARLFDRHDLGTFASAIAFKAIIGAVSLVLLGIGFVGAVGRKDVWSKQVAPHIEGRVLPDVFKGIQQTVDHIFARNSAGLIAFAAVFAVWQVSGAVRATMSALNRIYERDETRAWWQRLLVSVLLAVPVVLALFGAVLLGLAAGGLGEGWLQVPVAIGRWLLAVLLVGAAFGILVRYAPAERRDGKWVSVGAGLVVVGWCVEAIAFREYLTYLANFKTAVGSLTIVLVVTAYFYVASLILLLGIEADELLRTEAKKDAAGFHHVVRTLLGR